MPIRLCPVRKSQRVKLIPVKYQVPIQGLFISIHIFQVLKKVINVNRSQSKALTYRSCIRFTLGLYFLTFLNCWHFFEVLWSYLDIVQFILDGHLWSGEGKSYEGTVVQSN